LLEILLNIIPKEDCSTKGGMRKVDRKKLENKNKEKLKKLSVKKTKDNDKIKNKYVYLIYWDSKKNQHVRERIYMDDKR